MTLKKKIKQKGGSQKNLKPFNKRNILFSNNNLNKYTNGSIKKNNLVKNYYGHKSNYCYICQKIDLQKPKFKFNLFSLSTGRHHCRNCFISVCDKHFHSKNENKLNDESLCEICYKYKEYKIFNDFTNIKDKQDLLINKISKEKKNSKSIFPTKAEKNLDKENNLESYYIEKYPGFFEKKKNNKAERLKAKLAEAIKNGTVTKDMIDAVRLARYVVKIHYPFIYRVNLSEINFTIDRINNLYQWELIFNIWFNNEFIWELKKGTLLLQQNRATTNNPKINRLSKDRTIMNLLL